MREKFHIVFGICSLLFIVGLFYYWNLFEIINHWECRSLKSIWKNSYQVDDKRKFIKLYEEKARKWKEAAERKCQLYSKHLVLKPERHHMVLNKEANLGYCWIAKAGSSTSFRIWFEMFNLTIYKVNPLAVKMFSTSTDLSEFPDILKYTMVRHPFVRLVSFYLEMVQEWNGNEFPKYRSMVPNFEKWNTLLTKIYLNASERVTPWEFLMHVVEEIEACKSSSSSFKCLFNLNMHYKPYYISCSPCALNFDFVAKLDNFDEDFTYITFKVEEIYAKQNKHLEYKNKALIFKYTNKQNWILKMLRKAILGPKSNPSDFEIDTTDFTREIFSLLSTDFKRRLREAYFFDFLLFEYDQFEFT